MTYGPFFILGKLSREKIPLNLGLYLKYLLILIMLKGWCGTKHFYPCDPYYYILSQLS